MNQRLESQAVNSIKKILSKLDKESRRNVCSYINGWAAEIADNEERLKNACNALASHLGGVADARIQNVIQYCKNLEEEIKQLKNDSLEQK